MQDNSCFAYLVDNVEFDLCNKLNSVVGRPNIVNYLYLVVSGMISYYGSEFKDDIYDIVLSTNYLIDDNYGFRFTHTIRDVLSKNIGEYSSNYVMSICNIDKDDVLNSLETYRATYSLCITNVSISSIDILESLIRELNKIFLSKRNTFSYIGTDVILRNGISSTNLSNSNNIEDKKTINDVISCLQVEDILKEIKKLKYTGKNKDLNKLLNDISNYDMDNIILDCCLPLVNLFRPLFDFDYIKRLINTNMYLGNIDKIKNEFDSVLGNGSFEAMSKKLDKLYEDFYRGHLGGNINEYYISKEYVSIRDNFVHKYIKKKYA